MASFYDQPIKTVVTAMGVTTSLGSGIEPLWKALLLGESAVFKDSPEQTGLSMEASTFSQLEKSLGDDDGLILATTTGHLHLWEKRLIQYLAQEIDAASFAPYLAEESLGTFLEKICSLLGHTGPRLCITTACSASTVALVQAKRWIESGKVRRCFVVGHEVLGLLTVEGFNCFRLLSVDVARPFDKERQGINLAQGCAVLCLERESEEIKKEGRALSYLCGGAYSLDAYHMTAPHPQGQGAIVAIEEALKDASLSPYDIDWISAHGTGSYHNDLSEGKAITSVFGFEKKVPVTSTKSIHGHLLGASGIVETAICIKALQEQMVLGNTHLKTPDEAIPLFLPQKAMATKLNYILKMSLGFGGSNAALILGRV